VWRRAEAGLGAGPGFADIGAARARFEAMSAGAVALERRFGHRDGGSRRVVHCPMAFDGRGADWLQRGEAIDNPYFGAAMRRCGRIVETFGPNAATEGGAGHE
jgi:Cu(I)/Ag(I) efflux system membrane fusion protein